MKIEIRREIYTTMKRILKRKTANRWNYFHFIWDKNRLMRDRLKVIEL
jgi:hypothetical protein